MIYSIFVMFSCLVFSLVIIVISSYPKDWWQELLPWCTDIYVSRSHPIEIGLEIGLFTAKGAMGKTGMLGCVTPLIHRLVSWNWAACEGSSCCVVSNKLYLPTLPIGMNSNSAGK